MNLESKYAPPPLGTGQWSTETDYNLDRQLLQVRRPNGGTLDWSYDAAGRITGITQSTGAYGFTYNTLSGKLISINSPSGIGLSYTYDGSLPLTETWSGSIAGTVEVTYDNDFRPISQSINSGNSISLIYDQDSRITQIGSEILNYNSDNGQLASFTVGNTKDSLMYTQYGELMSQNSTFNGSTLYSAVFTRDKVGRITKKVETVQSDVDTFEYRYDLAGRLDSVIQNGSVMSIYAYDSNSNRIAYTTPSGTEGGVYDSQDRLLSYGLADYTYNSFGDLTSKTESGNTTEYVYDAQGNLLRVDLPDETVIEYIVDGRNRRVGKKVNGTLVKGWLYQNQLEPVAELDGSGNVIVRFIYGSKLHTPDYMIKGGVTYRIVTDYLGSIRMVVNASTGEVVQQLDYNEFGNITFDSNPEFQALGYAGGLYEMSTGLLRFGFRDYFVDIGRWGRKDPILFRTGQTNLFEYVKNNPLSFIDPTGLWTLPWSNKPGIPFDIPFGITRETHMNRNYLNNCPESAPQPGPSCDIKNQSWKEDKLFGKWRANTGSECTYGDFDTLLPDREANYTYNYQQSINPYSFEHIFLDVLPHFWYGGDDSYTPDLSSTY